MHLFDKKDRKCPKLCAIVYKITFLIQFSQSHTSKGVRMKKLDSFTQKYKLAKTLRFELRPVGKTVETFRTKFLSGDIKRSEDYEAVKSILDNEHKVLLERSLSNPPQLNWKALALAYEAYRLSDKSKEDKDALAEKTAEYRKALVKHFKDDNAFASLIKPTPKDIFKALKERYDAQKQPLPQALDTFFKFSCYFKGFQENRANIYSDAEQATAAANRAVNVNFPKFLDDIRIVGHLKDHYPEILQHAEEELASLLKGKSIVEMFTADSYGEFLSQSHIDNFNQILGGFVPAEGEKIRGINEFINLYRQQHTEAREDRNLAPLHSLYKQILSDRETLSLIPRMFVNDSDVLTSIRKMVEEKLLTFKTTTSPINVLDELQRLLSTITASSNLWIDGSKISQISKDFLGSWDTLGNLMESAAEIRFASESTQKKRETAIEKWLKKSVYALSELQGFQQVTETGMHPVDISRLWCGEYAAERFDAVRKTIDAVFPDLQSTDKTDVPLRENREMVAKIKAALDAVMDLLHYIKPLHAGDGLERDEAFYSPFDEFYDALDSFVPLYNKVRNYLTKKPGDAKRIKLMFENPTLADGWDANKEKDNTSVIFLKDGNYYLGIMNPTAKTDFTKLATKKPGDCYQKMVYKLLPGPNKMLPHVFFSEKGIEKYQPSQQLLTQYQAGNYKKGKTFDLAFCHELIDFFKASIAKHPDWSKFGFEFSPTKNYQGIDEFYREVSEQGYRISFDNIPVNAIDKLVAEGKLCLFQLWNKDFSSASTGRPNLHTMYWNAVFHPDNLRDVVIKLNGEAELFYRLKSIKEPFRHKVGEKMVNRRGKDGSPIPETVHGELFRHFNGSTEILSDEAKKWLSSGKLVIKEVTHEITKDARFTEDKFAFHVPLTLNFKAPDAPSKFNDQVRDYLCNAPDVKVIGIDRGERNLLYLALIDQQGNLLEQRSFNTLTHVRKDGVEVSNDYQQKLVQAENDRAAARLSWAEIGAIKDLKEGYLSAVVHEIAKMMVEQNAIVVLEDLNFGFKQGRFRIERQVYQKFEKALIDKLNYLVFKERNMLEPGGALRGYQLTDAFTSFERIGKQTGFLFYVPAGYTSKIDPTTGFTNLFNTKKCTNAVGIQEFFNAFDSIKWDEKQNAFAFAFDYKNFKTSQESHQTKWTVFSASRRLVFDKKSRGEKIINPTEEIRKALSGHGIAVSNGFDLKATIAKLTPSKTTDASLLKSIFYAFDRTLQMRNSNAQTGEDYIQSPVLNGQGEFFDSRKAANGLPKDADANGAYHIALKGLMLLQEKLPASKPDLKIEHKDWFRFAQELAQKKNKK